MSVQSSVPEHNGQPVPNAVVIEFEGDEHKKCFLNICSAIGLGIHRGTNCTTRGGTQLSGPTIAVLLPDETRFPRLPLARRLGRVRAVSPLDVIPPAPLFESRPDAADKFRRLQLALDGVADDTKDAASFRRLAEHDAAPWLWAGLVPSGAVSVLAGPPKGGKSTLLRGLLRATDQAWQSEADVSFLGAAVAPVRALVVSEEQPSDWRCAPDSVRIKLLGGAAPISKSAAWDAGVESTMQIAFSNNADLIILDSFAAICGASENSARAMTRAMAPLRALPDYGLSVLIIHHTTKTGSGPSSVRGSSAITAGVDSVLTLDAGDDLADPVRTLSVVGRRSKPATLRYTLRPDGTLALLGDDGGSRRKTLRGPGGNDA